jgi:hypothetical protein
MSQAAIRRAYCGVWDGGIAQQYGATRLPEARSECLSNKSWELGIRVVVRELVSRTSLDESFIEESAARKDVVLLEAEFWRHG